MVAGGVGDVQAIHADVPYTGGIWHNCLNCLFRVALITYEVDCGCWVKFTISFMLRQILFCINTLSINFQREELYPQNDLTLLSLGLPRVTA